MPLLASNTFISNITDSLTPAIVHVEDDFIDFNVQKLLPHKLSDLGPGLAVGDINGDGLDDMIMAASIGYSTKILTQQKNGKFNIRDLQPSPNRTTKASHDMGMLLFDADGDKDQDLFIAAGGNSWEAKLPSYSDHFYKNDGKGNFIIDTMALPGNNTSKAAVRAADFDHDGDLDLFIAGRCMPWQYPKPVSSFIYRNDSKDGKVVFTDVTAEVAKELLDIGLTCDGLFSDFDNDGWVDLVIAGEFMPVQFFKNNNGTFKRISTSIDAQKGWFNSLIAGDFDNDGDIDYVAGNNGTNTFFKASETYPVRVYGKDFDNNGAFDAIPSLYLVTSQTDTTLREYPANMRDDLIKQMIEMRARFRTYKDLAVSDFSKVLTPEQRNGATIATATNLSSLYIRNDGNGKFTMSPLPLAAQISSVFGMLAEDVNADGNLDLILVGNDYGTDVYVGRYDAFSGLVMLGDGNGNFAPQSILQSGFYLPGNAKAIVKLANSYKQVVLVATQNRGAMNSYLLKNARAERALSNEINCTIQLQNGKKRKEELYNGSGYLSNSGKFVIIGGSVKSLEFSDQKGAKRIVSF
jgi:hypothetical protein